MKKIPTLSSDTAKAASKTPASKKKHRRIALFAFLAILAAVSALIVAAVKSPKIKNALLLRFGTPQTYMAYVETNYLLAQGKEWCARSEAFSALFDGVDLSGAEVDVRISHLLSSLLQKNSATGEKPDLSGISLLFLTASKEENSLFQIAARANEVPIVSLDFLTDNAAKQFFIACPQAGSSALALSIAEDDPLIALIRHFTDLVHAFFASVRNAVSSDPYAYLLPYLDVITEVTLQRDMPLPTSDAEPYGMPLSSSDAGLTATRLDMTLSLDTALNIAAAQLDALKDNPDITDPLLPCYELSIRLLESIAEHYPADLFITAYVDDYGNILGHEFSILSQNEPLLSLTGILLTSPAGGKSGELTFFCALGKEPLTIQFSVSQVDFDLETGLVSGKVNFSCDRLSSLHFQLLFSSAHGLPKLSLLVRALGVTAVSFELLPTDTAPEAFPDPQDYAETYPLSAWSSFLQNLDFSGIIFDFYRETGIQLPISPFPFSDLF